VADAVRDSGVKEGMALVCAMHVTAGVGINDDEPGLLECWTSLLRRAGANPRARWPAG